MVFFFFKQKTAYEMRISDWSSDVCSSDLTEGRLDLEQRQAPLPGEILCRVDRHAAAKADDGFDPRLSREIRQKHILIHRADEIDMMLHTFEEAAELRPEILHRHDEEGPVNEVSGLPDEVASGNGLKVVGDRHTYPRLERRR